MPIEWTKGFQSIFNFDGRDGRRQFWIFVGTIWFAFILLSGLIFLDDLFQAYSAINAGGFLEYESEAARQYKQDLESKFYLVAAKAGAIAFLIPLILTASSFARRCHDIGFSGLWLIPVVLLGAPWALLLIGFLPSSRGDNKHGAMLD